MHELYHEYILRREKELRESKQENDMPTYTLKDTKTNSTWDVICSWDELQTTLNEMPDLVHVIGMPKIVHERGTNMKVDDGFREVISKVKEKHRVNNIKDY